MLNRVFRKKYPLYSAEQINQLSSQDFLSWIDFIADYPANFESEYGINYFMSHEYPKSNWLYECWCADEPHYHSRVFSSDLRDKYQKKIIKTILAAKKHIDPVSILSIGAGGLFQELILLLTLAKEGYKNITLQCIDVINNSIQRTILNAIIQKLNEYRHSNIQLSYEALSNTKTYDVVYAMDMDDFGSLLLGKDSSTRQLPQRTISEYNKKDTDLLKLILFLGFRQLNQDHALFLLSSGGTYLALTHKKSKVKSTEIDLFETNLENYAYHDCYYINANIVSLLVHLPLLQQQQKPVYINELLLNSEYNNFRNIVMDILAQQNFQVIIASEDEISNTLKDKTVLIIDDTCFNKQNNEHWLDEQFNHGYLQISRVDWENNKKACVLPSFATLKSQQLTTAINTLSLEDFTQRALSGIENYLQWHKDSGGFTKLLHWHSQSELDRAIFLKNKLIQASLTEDLPSLKAQFANILKESSNDKYSLSRFICSEFIQDKKIETLPDEIYQTVRYGFI